MLFGPEFPGGGMRMAKGEKRWWRRVLFGILLALLLLEVTWLVAGNIFLASDFLAGKLNRRPEKFSISWGRAITPLPGLLHVSGLHLSGRSPRIDWHADLERAWVRVELTPFFHREFSVTSADGRGLSVRFEPQSRAPGDDPEAASTPGEGGEGNAPESSAASRTGRPRWTIALRGLDFTGFRELTAGTSRLTGEGALRGGLTYVTRGELQLDGVTLDFPRLELTRKGTLVADDLRLACHLESDPFNPREHRGRHAMAFVTARAELAGRMAEPIFLNDFLANAPWLQVQGEEGRIDANLVIDHGVVRAGSRVDFRSEWLAAKVLDNMATGRGVIEARVSGEGPDVVTEVIVAFEEMEITRDEDDEPHLRGSGLRISSRASEIQLDGDPPQPEVRVDLIDAEAQDLSLYNDYLPASADVAFTAGGRCRVDAFLEVIDGRGRAGLTLSGDSVSASVRQVPLEGDLELDIGLVNGRIPEMTFDIAETRLSLDNVTFTGADDQPVDDWWARAWLEGGTLTWARPFTLEAPVKLEMRDSRPVVALFAEGSRTVRWLRTLLEIENITGRTDLRADRRLVTLTDLELHGKELEILSDLEFRRRKSDGLIFVKFHRIAAATEGHEGRKSWKLFGARDWFNARRHDRRQAGR